MASLHGMPFSSGKHDRAAARRRDDAWLEEVRRASTTRILVVRSSAQLLMEGDRLGHLAASDVPDDAELTFLGIDAGGRAMFVLDSGIEESRHPSLAERAFAELRAVGMSPYQDDAALAAQAVALVGWHRRHRFCGSCGGETVAEEAGHSRRCLSCGTQHFPRTDPAVIMLVTSGDRCVLSRRRGGRAGMWTALSGFVEPGETPEDAVAREVLEEVGLRVFSASYRGAQPWPFPLSLMLAYDAEADYAELTVDEELEDARWFTRRELRQAVAEGAVSFPPPMSVAYHLVRTWLEDQR